MGISRDAQAYSYNRDTQIAIDSTQDGHGLPLTNFPNAQCTPSLTRLTFRLCDSGSRHPAPGIQSGSRHREFKPLGSVLQVYFDRMLLAPKVRLLVLLVLPAERDRFRDPIRQW